MNSELAKTSSLNFFILLAVAIIVTGSFAYSVYRYDKVLEDTRSEFSQAQAQFQSVRENLEARLASTTEQNNDLIFLLGARNADFQNQIGEMSEKISMFEKLWNTDAELLQKYSKVYFLNENYIPSALSLIEQELTYSKTKPVQVHSGIKTYLESMVRAAQADGIDITVFSGYRSFGTQASLKSQYTVVYGSNSNRFSADQGYSEHQLGTTVDFTTKKKGEELYGFDKEPAYKWLTDNAYRFGFILSYPKGNTFYIFEPWHWRFVGLELSSDLHSSGKRFYDMPQRSLDQYLVKIF